MIRLALSIFFISFNLYAEKSTPETGDAFGYYRVEGLPHSPANLDRAIAASVRLATDINSGSNCSAVILSRSGYVATALHCLNYYLNGSLDFAPRLKIQKKKIESTYSYWKVLEQKAAKEEIPSFISDTYYIWEFDLKFDKFIWFGRGRHNHEESMITTLSDSEFNSFKDLTDDIVIMKYKSINQDSKVTCIPRAHEKPMTGKMVWGIGFPDSATRSNGQNSDGYSEYISIGNVRKSVKEDPVLQKISVDIPQNLRGLFWKREALIWERDSILISSIDLSPGNSGGMVLDEKGNLVGITFSTTVVDSKKETQANSYAVDINFLYSTIKRQLGLKMADEIFNCAETENE